MEMRAIVLCRTVESFAIMDMLIFMCFRDMIMMDLVGHILRVSQSILRGLQRNLGLDTKLMDVVRIERVAEYDGVAVTTKIDCEAVCKHIEENDIRCVVIKPHAMEAHAESRVS